MPAFIKYTTAKENEHYIELVNLCVASLQKHGCFRKEDMIAAAGLNVFSHAIQWDFVQRMLEEKHKIEVVAVAAKFFKLTKGEKEALEYIRLNEYMAKGHGKRTVGYVSAKENNGKWYAKQVENRAAISRGWELALERDLKRLDSPEYQKLLSDDLKEEVDRVRQDILSSIFIGEEGRH